MSWPWTRPVLASSDSIPGRFRIFGRPRRSSATSILVGSSMSASRSPATRRSSTSSSTSGASGSPGDCHWRGGPYVAEESMVVHLTDDDLPPVVLFIGFAALALCMPPQNETWWPRRAGLEMINSGGILATERFSHTNFGAPLYHNHEWLTQLLFYGLFVAGGPVLLAVFCAACAVSAIAGAWRLVQGGPEARFGFLALMMVGCVVEGAIRPQVISLALFVVAVHLVLKGLDRWLPLLCVVWSNMHAVAIVGAVIAGCSALEAVIWSRARARRAILIAVACVLAAMATPQGWHYWPRVVQVVRTVRALHI